jgi:hypothetical protein
VSASEAVETVTQPYFDLEDNWQFAELASQFSDAMD